MTQARESVQQQRPDAGVPPGWSYNPSSWHQRLPLVGLAAIGFTIATYLSLYQWRVIADVWDPFFGDGSRRILNSPISRLLPLPDAALGALGYVVDAVAGLIGGRWRWRTMPWIVIIFGVAVGPLGAVSIMLVIFQPVLFGAWCTLCLVSAIISLTMIGPAMDEVLAGLQVIRRAHHEGRSVWRTFWGLDGGESAEAPAPHPPAAGQDAAAGGHRAIWARLLSIAAGVWLMAAPAVLGYGGAATVNDRIAGPLSAAAAFVSVSEITRPVRWLNVPVGGWLLLAPWLLGYARVATVNSLACGALLLALAFVPGARKERFGGGWASLLR